MHPTTSKQTANTEVSRTLTATMVPNMRQIRVGVDFVDAVNGTAKSHGWMELKPVAERNGEISRYTWQSTQSIEASETALRREAEKCGFKVVAFMSQACQPLPETRCPKCKSIDVDKFHHTGTFALPECYYLECIQCGHQWNHA